MELVVEGETKRKAKAETDGYGQCELKVNVRVIDAHNGFKWKSKIKISESTCMKENERERGKVQGNNIGKARTWEPADPSVLQKRC